MSSKMSFANDVSNTSDKSSKNKDSYDIYHMNTDIQFQPIITMNQNLDLSGNVTLSNDQVSTTGSVLKLDNILPEPFLEDNDNRLTAYPIKHRDIWDMYKRQRALNWDVEEVALDKDYTDFLKLSPEEQHFIKYVLAFFAGSDGLVNLNLVENFIEDVSSYEAKITYRFQAAMEDVHNEMYSLLIETLIKDPVEKHKLMNALHTIPMIAKKGEWTQRWIQKHDTFAARVFAFAIVEGIFFSGSFCAIYWIKDKNLMPGLVKSNEFISRDESMHTEFACLIYSKLKNRLPQNVAHDIIREAVLLEQQFICDALPYNLPNMNSKLMGKYIEYVADILLVMLDYTQLYHQSNPFAFMEAISLESKTNFFEHKPSEYQKAINKNGEGNHLSLLDEF